MNASSQIGDPSVGSSNRANNRQPVHILIVTVTKVEIQAVLEAFSCNDQATLFPYKDGIYYNLGMHRNAQVYMVQSKKGGVTPGGAATTIQRAIQDLEPIAIIMCGIAFGLRPDKHELGDILISEQLYNYGPQKIDKKQGILHRGDKVSAPASLVRRFSAAELSWQGRKTYQGLMVSGEILVNAPKFRRELLKDEPEAIGGDMEGSGLYAAATEHKKDWIIIKAISDWADGKKRDDAQPSAARNAARFVYHALNISNWPDSTQDSKGKATRDEDNSYQHKEPPINSIDAVTVREMSARKGFLESPDDPSEFLSWISDQDNLKEYIHACSILAQNLDQAITDIDFSLRPDHKIYYAVDFSELHEFIFPSEAFLDFVLFPRAFENKEEDLLAARAIEQLILRYILLELDPKEIILLPPYQIEYQYFIHKFRSKLIDNLKSSADILYHRFQEIASRNISAQILDICQKARESRLTADEEAILSYFIEQNGQYLSILENIDSHNSPWKRLRLLDPRNSFKLLDLSNYQFTEENDTEVYTRWHNKLSELRPYAITASNIDAMAIQILYSVNRVWSPNKRLVLITRSKYMHEIYRKEYEEKCSEWEEIGEYYLLRHPSVFGLILPTQLKDSPFNRDYLANLRDCINRFLAVGKSYQYEDLPINASLHKEITEINEQWKMIQQFTITLSSSTYVDPYAKRNLATQAELIMNSIRNQLESGNLVKYLESLLLELDKYHEGLYSTLHELDEYHEGLRFTLQELVEYHEFLHSSIQDLPEFVIRFSKESTA